MQGVAAGWTVSHNEELHHSYSAPNILRVIKSKDLLCGLVVTGLGSIPGATRFPEK
jgi:hypothetical protein